MKVSYTREYKVWQSMKDRCLRAKSPAYKDYGGRGITVCDRWKKSFHNFISDMGPCPKGFWIERKNNNLGYCPENCAWKTPKENTNNRRDFSTKWKRVMKLPRPGLTLKEAAGRMGIPYSAARYHLSRIGYKWSDGRAFGQRVRRILDPDKIDWRKSDLQIARELLISKQRVNRVRHEFHNGQHKNPLTNKSKKGK